MAVFPGANWRPLPENGRQPAISPTQFIVHTAVDNRGPSSMSAHSVPKGSS